MIYAETSKLPEAFVRQAKACAGLGSPFMHRLCTLLADRLRPGTALTDRLFAWPGDLGPAAESVPLRVCGALHALRLADRAGLAALYPPNTPDDAALWAGIAHAFETEADFINTFIDSAPQTNEVRRSISLICAAHWLTTRHDLPIRTSELGASAGINLNWDRYALSTPEGILGPPEPALTFHPEWTGGVPAGPRPDVISKQGVDLNPVTDTERLKAYLWPDQPERMTLTEAALAAGPRDVAAGDAVDWLATRMGPQPGTTHLIYSTVAWQYFPPERQASGTALIEAAGAKATPDAPLAWFGMENDRGSPGAAMTLRLWPGDETHALGRIDFHGRWIRWDA